MKRNFALMMIAGLAIATSAFAQSTLPQAGSTQNQNSPQMQVTPPSTAQAPASTSSPAPAGVVNAPATTNPKTTAPARDVSTPASDDKKADAKATDKNNGDEPTGAINEGPKPEVKTPHTEMVGTPSSGPQSADPLLQPAPLPANQSTLIGGIAKKVDGIRNRVVIAPFGSSKSVTVQFDERSHIYRDSHETTILAIKKGDRVYADTMLVGPKVFARNIRVITSMSPAEASGQVVAYDEGSQTVRIVDKLTNTPVTFRIVKDTELRSTTGQATAADVRPGALVSVIFAPGRTGGDARQISVLAVPGTKYIFAGRVTNFDIHAGIVDVDNQSDGKNYELHFPPSMENRGELRIGAQVAANATFDGHIYSTQQVTVMAEQSENAQQ